MSHYIYRSITELPRLFIVGNEKVFEIHGKRSGENFRAILFPVNSWDESKKYVIEHWLDKVDLLPKRLCINLSADKDYNACLLVESKVDEECGNPVSSKTRVLVEVQSAIRFAMLLFWGGLGPYLEETWTFQKPLRGISRSKATVGENDFLCSNVRWVRNDWDVFERVFYSLLSRRWSETKLGRVLDLGMGFLLSSIRAESPDSALVLLSIAFESLFSEEEGEWAGSSSRLSKLVAKTKNEKNQIHASLNRGENSLRVYRNAVVHGGLSIDYKELNLLRQKFAAWIAQAIVKIILAYEDGTDFDNYYPALARVCDETFKALPDR